VVSVSSHLPLNGDAEREQTLENNLCYLQAHVTPSVSRGGSDDDESYLFGGRRRPLRMFPDMLGLERHSPRRVGQAALFVGRAPRPSILRAGGANG
jgi:hypothetical protein